MLTGFEYDPVNSIFVVTTQVGTEAQSTKGTKQEKTTKQPPLCFVPMCLCYYVPEQLQKIKKMLDFLKKGGEEINK